MRAAWMYLSLGLVMTTGCRLAFDDQQDSYSSAVLADSPIAYWRLDDTAPALARDEIGDHDGVYNGTCQLGTPGAIGSAVRFDGASCEVACGAGPAFANTPAFSIELWADITIVDGSVRWLVSYFTPAAPDIGYSLAVFDGTLWFEMVNDATSEMYMPTTPPAPGFHHLAVTVQPGQQRFYVDGEIANEQVFGAPMIPAATGSLVLGHYARPNPTNFFGGGLDEVAFYDRALTQAQIQAHIAAR